MSRSFRMFVEERITTNESVVNSAKGLHSAAASGSVEKIKSLIKLGADVDETDPKRDDGTPLHVAAEAGNIAVIQALIAAGADPSIENNDGKTPLDIAEDKGASRQVIAALKVAQRSTAA